ncbi:MAG: Flp pilus assembly complex ATPase component TadA [Nanoarchaeota archaeon]|nr:Flp pilus assembly complex ATPase component TadA [Nanoarchaeota archaeon]MBU1050956.1 Flp pilus assembly complex ATPase component TadA [Nanoarchaeota archaeon]MBU1988417.1 Flp pilus assembly complex ATPase component TadA [Nanoarchaeota archaeon]
MIFKKGSALYATELERKEGEDVLYINAIGTPFVPTIAENADIMSRTIDFLAENPNVSRIIFVQQRNYSYPSKQILLLGEIARVYNFLTKQEEILSPRKLSLYGSTPEVHEDLQYLVGLLKQHPIGCYLEIKDRIRDLKKQLEQGEATNRSNLINYIRILERFFDLLENTKLIKTSLSLITESAFGKREIYKSIFRPEVLPNFTFTRLAAQIPKDAELIDQYEILGDEEKTVVTILKRKNDSKHFYHIMPPEYILSEEHHMLLNLGRNVLSEHRPKAEEFTDPERTRNVFTNIARDMLSELSKSKGINLNHRELITLSKILVRHTIGFGLIELLLMDSKLQDIVLNAPITQNPIFVRHEEYDECVTNIIPSFEDANSWAAKLRLLSGRPLDEANPVLDTDLSFENARARVAATTQPLSPKGLAYAFRRHRDQPWTLPLFINNKMINSFTAGLLSFLIDGSRTLLVAGTRSSGKTSLLGSLMLEILPKFRTIVIEDTLELPVETLRKIGYDILSLKVRSALTSGTTEVEASEGIRASLRLGDSALIIGEVRSEETKALYEAMRVGALANVVAGTIHGDSPYGVFDRVVNDLGVQPTSFKATDLIILTAPIKTPDGLHSMKRVVQVTEVRKHWNKDPLDEKGFVDLVRYNVEKDELIPTDELINGDSEIIKSIAGNVKGWAGNWDAVYDNILLRGKVKQEIVIAAEKLNKPELMEAPFNTIANGAFHRISDQVRQDLGIPKSDEVFSKWKEWLYKEGEKF